MMLRAADAIPHSGIGLLKILIYAKLFLFGYSNDKQLTSMIIKSEI